jgi:serine/threonine-protein kinase
MKKLDRFILRDILSDGPAGTVYKAEEVLPGDNRRTVALKVLPELAGGTGESDGERRFFGEVRVLAQLAVHPHVVTIYGMGITDNFPWLAMEYSAQTLQQRLSESPADPAEVFRMMEQVAKGLQAMHCLKPPLIHQDIKPANILVDQCGNFKITDFSLATVTAANKTHGLATVRYAAPELLSSEFGSVGPATDLYALGHIAYEMALGATLHRAQFPAIFEGNSTKEPPPNKWMMWHASIGMKPTAAHEVNHGFPAVLGEVIDRLMAKLPGQRYASAEELLSDLAVLRHQTDAASTAAPVAASAVSTPATVQPRAATAAPRTPATAFVPPPASSAGSAAGAVPPPSASSPRYWVRLRGKVTGPFDLPTLQRQLKQGHISRLHQVSADQVTWKQASDLEGLYGPTVV